MDEALIMSAVDLSGRGCNFFDVEFPAQKVGDFDTELASEFWDAFCYNAKITMHTRKLAGRNAHHIIEGVFKANARSLRKAVSIDEKNANEIPSTKGML
jgi:imidazoleglycerol-phosphate dehydratase